ncbi:MAG: chemotaxis protein CheA [Proteobacteria bacterium]|nr:chemotaxis protein CheA [Pseudomonadota bacterium]
MNIDSELLQAFIDESMDYLSGWERACLELEKSGSMESIQSLFRTAHSLKGTSRCVGTSTGLKEFGDFVHKIEDILNILLKGETKPEKFLIDLFLECETVIREWLTQIAIDPEFVISAAETLAKVEDAVRYCEQGPITTPTTSELTADTEDSEAILNDVQIEEKKLPIEEKELEIEANAQTDPQVSNKSASPKSNETIRVSSAKLDALIQMVGELSIHQSIIWHAKQTDTLNSKSSQNSIVLGNKITKELQAQTMSLRMQPLQSLFQKLERVARDVARETGKAIEIKVKGEDVELDKSIIDGISDPLVHVLRNAVDHGIETLDERSSSGKQLMATVNLNAEQDANGVVVSISDDGKGLDTERIKQKAIEKKLISKNTQLSTQEIHQLIFQPGFSTAEKVTNFSGRGVGMDVVKKAMDTLGGEIEIFSEKGKGTEFSFTLPTSMSILEALIVALSGIRYAVPIQHLAEIIDTSQFNIETTSHKEKMFALRGKVLPLQDLKDYLPKKGKDADNQGFCNINRPALVVKNGQERIAFAVDSIVGQQQIVVRQLNAKLKDIPGFCGGTILGDGEPGLIIDLPSIAKEYLEATKYREKKA